LPTKEQAAALLPRNHPNSITDLSSFTPVSRDPSVKPHHATPLPGFCVVSDKSVPVTNAIMRPLNVYTLKLEERKNEAYAILSHTWGEGEVSFAELGTEGAEQKAGYGKILETCAQAERDGHRFVWIDSCCIDKRSSAELSEAINSMFRWYQESEICYVFLEDVETLDDMKTARWFTRGWTLQQLLAPRKLVYLNATGDASYL
jgi:hypothetical protein